MWGKAGRLWAVTFQDAGVVTSRRRGWRKREVSRRQSIADDVGSSREKKQEAVSAWNGRPATMEECAPGSSARSVTHGWGNCISRRRPLPVGSVLVWRMLLSVGKRTGG